ncbi:MAG TPA: toll/interleukin-1 receptor domain-containing protein [Ktedonobacteraceae bacterium]
MEKHLFISYKHEDSDFAEVLIRRFEKAGFKIWVDHDQLHIGEDWRNEIDQAIKNSFALIVIMTPEAKASEYVTYEWAFAWGLE